MKKPNEQNKCKFGLGNMKWSVNVDFRNSEYDFLHLSGSWGRERYVERQSLRSGVQSVESRRGASSHQQNPFIALLRKGTDENSGEVYGFNLVYSGNFIAQAEVDQFKNTRVSLGLNPFDFNADKIESIAKAGKELGMELFVLDDRWFGKRERLSNMGISIDC